MLCKSCICTTTLKVPSFTIHKRAISNRSFLPLSSRFFSSFFPLLPPSFLGRVTFFFLFHMREDDFLPLVEKPLANRPMFYF